jgi:hypothetical protein
MMTNDNELTRAVVRVGDGRGFVVDLGRERVIITAAHCLPWKKLPAPQPGYSGDIATFANLLGPPLRTSFFRIPRRLASSSGRRSSRPRCRRSKA